MRHLLSIFAGLLLLVNPVGGLSAADGAAAASEQASALIAEGKEAEALALLRKAAAAGDANAADFLGWFYENGRYVGQSNVKAAELYHQAAAHGIPHAQWRLGVMIDMGNTSGELEQAVAFFKSAAQSGYSNAWVSLGVMQATGRGTPTDYVSARANYDKAARVGNDAGFHGLGVLYGNGEGVDVDPIRTMAFWLVAKALENEDARGKYDRFKKQFSDPELALILAAAEEIATEYGVSVNLRAARDDQYDPNTSNRKK